MVAYNQAVKTKRRFFEPDGELKRHSSSSPWLWQLFLSRFLSLASFSSPASLPTPESSSPFLTTVTRRRYDARRVWWAIATPLTLVIAALLGYFFAGHVIPVAGGLYSEAIVGTPRYLNPVLALPGSPDDDITALVFSGLTRVNIAREIVPDLAESWTVSPDGRIYTFRIRKDVLWHDGKPFVADDVVATIKHLQTADFPGESMVALPWQGIDVELTPEGVRFTLPTANSWFLEQASIGVIPAHVTANLRGRALLESGFNRMPIGTGPYRVTSADLRRVQLTVNSAFHGQVPLIRDIDLRFFGTVESAVAAARRNEVMAIRPIPATDLGIPPPGFNVLARVDAAKTVSLVFNTRPGQMDDAGIRAAIASSIDRATVAATLNGAAVGTDDLPADLSMARATFERLGWRRSSATPPGPNAIENTGPLQRDGRSFTLSLVINDRPERVAVADEIARQLGAMGIRVDIQKIGWGGMIGDVLPTGRFQSVLLETFDPAAMPNPAAVWQSNAPLNVGKWSNKRSDELLVAALRATTEPERQTALRDWRAVFVADAPAIDLYRPGIVYVVSQEIQGQNAMDLRLPRDRFASIADWYVFTKWTFHRF